MVAVEATLYSQPIRTQCLEGSGPMRGLDSASVLWCKTCLCSTETLELEVNTVPPEERTVRWGAALSQEREAAPRLETLQGSTAAPPYHNNTLFSQYIEINQLLFFKINIFFCCIDLICTTRFSR